MDIIRILEKLTEIGFAPCLISDDNGGWAISDEGVSNVRLRDTDPLHITHYIKASDFKSTMREAFDNYLQFTREQ